MPHLGRRAFLIAAAAFAPRTAGGWFAQPRRRDIDVFLEVSARLTGETRLSEGAARLYLDGLLTSEEKRRLLYELPTAAPVARTAAHVALEEEIVIAWFTGTYDHAGERRVATHAHALMWRALGRPAPGVCSGPRASWSQPPPGR